MRKIVTFLPYFCMLLAFIISIFRGVNTCKGWNDDTQLRDHLKEGNLTVEPSDSEEDISFLLPEEVSSFEQLCGTADAIVRLKVTANNERTMYTECTLTTAKVLEVYQGNVSGKTLSIFEPAYIDKHSVWTVGAYQLMEDNKEYIVFLREIQCSLYNGQKSVYLPTTTALSKYQCTQNRVTGKAYKRKEDKELNFNEVYSYDALILDKQILDLYQIYQKQIQTLIGGGHE